MLRLVLPKWGPKLEYLSLDRTFVTVNGLGQLEHCPRLRDLRLCECSNILDKSRANEALGNCIAKMADLRNVAVSGSRVSGRMFSHYRERCGQRRGTGESRQH